MSQFTLIQRVNDVFARMAIGSVYSMRWPKFRAQLENAAAQQEGWLLNRVQLCRDTRFGRDHGFADIKTLADFRKRVPIARYDYFAPYIQSVASGDSSALIPSTERLVQFTITTGSGAMFQTTRLSSCSVEVSAMRTSSTSACMSTP